jgi:hypothetical protein
MKLSEIVTRVQRQFGDDVQAQITKEDIVRWVNDACLEIVTNNHTNEGMFRGITPVVVGQDVYDLPSDMLVLRAVRVNGLSMKATTYEQLIAAGLVSEDSSAPDQGTPSMYWVHDDKINLVPVPDTALGTVDIMYVKTPDILTSAMLDREPDVPTQYHLRIVEYCIAQAAELDDNEGKYQMKMQQFKNNLDNLRSNGEQPEADGVYPSITYVSDGW